MYHPGSSWENDYQPIKKSIIKEVENITKMPGFKGYINDLGGPSANMYQIRGSDQSICDKCASQSCIHPTICYNLYTSHKSMLDIYKSVQNNLKVKKSLYHQWYSI